MANLSFSQLLGLAQGAGFSGSSANTAAAIAMAESGGDPYALNYESNGSVSYGLTQMNSVHGPSASGAYGNPQSAFSQMYSLSNGGQNFSPWGAFNNGSYSQYLPAGSSAPSDNGGITVLSPTYGGAGGAAPGQTVAPSFWDSLTGQGGSNPGIDAINNGGLGEMGGAQATDALGNIQQTSGVSALSQIFAAIGNLFQRGGFILLGLILIAIGAYFVARPEVQRAARSVGRKAAVALA